MLEVVGAVFVVIGSFAVIGAVVFALSGDFSNSLLCIIAVAYYWLITNPIYKAHPEYLEWHSHQSKGMVVQTETVVVQTNDLQIEEPEIKFCTSCGVDLNTQAVVNFCLICGHKLK